MHNDGTGVSVVMCSVWDWPNISSSLMAKKPFFCFIRLKNHLPINLGAPGCARLLALCWAPDCLRNLKSFCCHLLTYTHLRFICLECLLSSHYIYYWSHGYMKYTFNLHCKCARSYYVEKHQLTIIIKCDISNKEGHAIMYTKGNYAAI